MHIDMVLGGLLVGILVGLTGIGGGSLLAPALVAFFGVGPLNAVGTALFVKAAMKSLALVGHIQAREINYKVGGLLIAGAAPSAVAAVIVLIVFDYVDFPVERWAHWMLAGIALLAGAATLLHPLYSYRFQDADVRVLASLKVRITAIIVVGVVTGGLLALTAIGGSALAIPMLGFLYLMPQKRIAGTDAFLTAIVAVSAGLFHAVGGNISWVVAANVSIGAMPGLLLGLWLTRRRVLPEVLSRTVLGVLVASMGIQMLVSLFRGGETPVS